MIRRYPGIFLLPIALTACSKGEKVPAYLEVASVTLTTTPEQGASTSKITDAWISVDGTLIGVWELPARLPVLAEGDHIPADARVVEEYGLRVNQSTLTGEAIPARKTADADD